MHACKNPRLADKIIVFSKHEIFHCHGNTIKIFQEYFTIEKSPKNITFNYKLSISQTYMY